VAHTRTNCFRPLSEAASLDDLNAAIVCELEADLSRRRLPDGRTAEMALIEEREHLRPLPARMQTSARTKSAVADKLGHVRLDRVTYSEPIVHAYRPILAQLSHDRVEPASAEAVVATHARSYWKGELVLDPMHVLPLLQRKHRAIDEASALQGFRQAPVLHEL
jgi:hypothetical protein